jgi:hypothetical protein
MIKKIKTTELMGVNDGDATLIGGLAFPVVVVRNE